MGYPVFQWLENKVGVLLRFAQYVYTEHASVEQLVRALEQYSADIEVFQSVNCD